MKARIEKTLKTKTGEKVTILERLYESEFSENVGWFFVSGPGYSGEFVESVEEAEKDAREEFDIR